LLPKSSDIGAGRNQTFERIMVGRLFVITKTSVQARSSLHFRL
jgi:hypothetical protein